MQRIVMPHSAQVCLYSVEHINILYEHATQLAALAALLSMPALSCQQFPAFMSEKAVHVLRGPHRRSLFALCMLCVYPACVLKGCLFAPSIKRPRRQRFSAWVWFPRSSWGWLGPRSTETSVCKLRRFRLVARGDLTATTSTSDLLIMPRVS
jgi:hypothetical protein